MFYCTKEFVGKTLKELRKKSGIKQNELAEKIGISEKHLSKIETGKNYPSLDNFLKMAEILNFNLDSFGLNSMQSENKDRVRLLEIIYSSSEKDLKDFLDFIVLIQRVKK